MKQDVNDTGWALECPACGLSERNQTEGAWGDPPICPGCGSDTTQMDAEDMPEQTPQADAPGPILAEVPATADARKQRDQLLQMLDDIFAGKHQSA